MPSGWLPDVVPDEPIESVWGNTIRDRTVTPFANAAERDASIVAPTDGMLVYLEDVDQLQGRVMGAWRAIGLGTIASQTLSGGAAAVTFDAIPQTFTHLQILGTARGTDTNLAYLSLRFNSDTTNEYYTEQVNATGAPTPALVQVGAQATFATVGLVAGASAPAGMVSPVNITIPNYRAAGIARSMTWQSGANYFTSLRYETGAALWTKTPAVTRIDLAAITGQLTTGTILTLSGVS